MKLQFPVYVIGGRDDSWPLKSKLDENEYLLLFTSAELAQQFIANHIKNPDGLVVKEIAEDKLREILERIKRSIPWIVLDFRTPAECRFQVASLSG